VLTHPANQSSYSTLFNPDADHVRLEPHIIPWNSVENQVLVKDFSHASQISVTIMEAHKYMLPLDGFKRSHQLIIPDNYLQP
jgi:hypothetical protein